MFESISTLIGQYGVVLVFFNVLLVHLGLPIPAAPGLILAGGLAAAGKLDPVLVVAAAVFASTLADYSWYLTGRRLGYPVLGMFSRLFPSPKLCVQQAEAHYARWGIGLLLCAKFMPGVALIAPPLAGVLHKPRHLFLLYAGMGGLLWAGTYVAHGYVFDVQADIVVKVLENAGVYTAAAMLAVFATSLFVRMHRRRRLLKLVEATKRK
jgi:membrane protein DedA with SNARE-associated domain